MSNRILSLKEIADDLNAELAKLSPAEQKMAILGFAAQSMDGVPLMTQEEFKRQYEAISAEMDREKASKE